MKQKPQKNGRHTKNPGWRPGIWTIWQLSIRPPHNVDILHKGQGPILDYPFPLLLEKGQIVHPGNEPEKVLGLVLGAIECYITRLWLGLYNPSLHSICKGVPLQEGWVSNFEKTLKRKCIGH